MKGAFTASSTTIVSLRLKLFKASKTLDSPLRSPATFFLTYLLRTVTNWQKTRAREWGEVRGKGVGWDQLFNNCQHNQNAGICMKGRWSFSLGKLTRFLPSSSLPPALSRLLLWLSCVRYSFGSKSGFWFAAEGFFFLRIRRLGVGARRGVMTLEEKHIRQPELCQPIQTKQPGPNPVGQS